MSQFTVYHNLSKLDQPLQVKDDRQSETLLTHQSSHLYLKEFPKQLSTYGALT